MATNTSILGLTKPAYTDDADVAVINSNSDLIDAEAGRTRANFAAEYSTSSAYAVGAFCTHAGNLYQCNTAIGSGGEAWTAAHWTQKSVAEAVDACNQAIASINNNMPNNVDKTSSDITIDLSDLTWSARTGCWTASKSASTYFGNNYTKIVNILLVGYSGIPVYIFLDGQYVIFVNWASGTPTGNIIIRAYYSNLVHS